MPPPSKRRIAPSLSPVRPQKKLKNGYGSPHTPDRQGSEISFKNGAIVKIELKDFMTHQSIVIEPNPKINILSGVNGSGKSSILLGISVGLGAKAKSTHRSSKLSEYVREGQVKAVTKIHLYNGNEATAHDHDIYGDRIMVQREINAKSTSLEIRDYFGKLIKSGAKARTELDHILSKFHVDVENSVIIMHQEEAKSFFQHAEPNKLFNFYMKGTLLQKIKQKGLESNQHIKSIDDSVERNKKDIAEMEEKQKIWEEAIQVLDSERNDQSQNAAKHAWAKYHTQDKPAMIKAQQEHEAKKKEYANEEASVKKKAEAQEAKTEELERMSLELNQYVDQVRNLDNENNATRETRERLVKQLAKLEEEYEGAERDVMNHRNTIQILKNEIRKSKMDVNKNQEVNPGDDNQTELNRLEDERKTLDEQVAELKSKNSELGKQRDVYETESDRIDRESNKQKNHLDSLKRRININRAYQQEMNRTQSKDKLSRFGERFVALCNDIDQQANQFKSKPIGPIGQYIRVNEESAGDETLCTLIETQINKKTLESFIVEKGNEKDFHKLKELMSRHFPNGNPNIIKRKSYGSRYDINRTRVPKDCNVQTILDHLTFQHDEVFNHVVDSLKIEKILVTTDNKAQELFRNKNTVPKNTFFAVTRSFNKYFPPTDKSNYASYYIWKPQGQDRLLITLHNQAKQMENEESSFREEVRKLENELRGFDEKKREHNMKKAAVVEEIKQHQNNINDLLKQKTIVMSELSKISDKNRSIHQLEENVKLHERKLNNASQLKIQKVDEKKKVKMALEEISTEKLDLYESNRHSLCLSRDKLQEKIESAKRSLSGLQSNVLKEKKDLARTKKILDSLEANFKSAQTKAQATERKALNLSNGVQVKAEEVPSSKKEFEAQLKLQKQRAEKLKEELGMNDTQLVEATNKLVNDISKLKIDTHQNSGYSKRLFDHAKHKSDTLEKWKEDIVRHLRIDFREALKANGILRAELDVDYEHENLNIKVSSSNTSNQVALSSLSGGEKSKVLGCLLYALWHHVQCPFRGVDEWDVFLDHQARADMERLMYDNVKRDDHQYFFISPQDSTMLTPTWIEKNKDWALVITLQKNQ